jgi:hypothetical protein
MAAAAQEQSAGVDQVNRAVTQMDHSVQATASQAEGLSSTAETLASQSMHLEVLVSRFKADANDRGGERADDARPIAGDRPAGTTRAAARPREQATPRPVVASTHVRELAAIGAERRRAAGVPHGGDGDFARF